MTTSHYSRHEQWAPVRRAPCDIIRIGDSQSRAAKRRNKRSDVFWNVVFAGLCLSVLVVLFCH
jgi:hypothetical protein